MPIEDRLVHGDCVEVLKELPDASVPLIWGDPPYNLSRDYGTHFDDNKPLAEYLAWCGTWLAQCRRVIAKDGTMWLALGQQVYPEVDAIVRAAGFIRRRAVIWHYTFGMNIQTNFTLSYTVLAYYVASKKYHFDVDAVRVPSARQLIYNDKRANPRGRLPDDVWFLRPQDIPGGLPADGDVWHCPRVAGTFKSKHAVDNQIPEQVVGRCMLMTSKPGDLVVDPFGGSYTTAAVAKKLGRRYFSCELSADYHARGEARVALAKLGDPLAGPNIQE